MPYANIEDRRANRRAYRAKNRERVREWNKKWGHRNPERLKEVHRNYYEENKEGVLTRTRAWQIANAEKEYERSKLRRVANPEKARAACRKWQQKNLPIVAAIAAKRRAMKRACPVDKDRTAYYAFARSVRAAARINCYWCGKNVPKKKRHIDHIYPISKGGADAVANLCCACQHCNESKHDKLPHEFSGQHEIQFPVM